MKQSFSSQATTTHPESSTPAKKQIVMPVLRFVCPATGHQVETDIDLDPESFACLPRDWNHRGRCLDDPRTLNCRRGADHNRDGDGVAERRSTAECPAG